MSRGWSVSPLTPNRSSYMCQRVPTLAILVTTWEKFCTIMPTRCQLLGHPRLHCNLKLIDQLPSPGPPSAVCKVSNETQVWIVSTWQHGIGRPAGQSITAPVTGISRGREKRGEDLRDLPTVHLHPALILNRQSLSFEIFSCICRLRLSAASQSPSDRRKRSFSR